MEKNLTTKAGVLTYLQDAKAIEKDIYALEQMEKELKKRAGELQKRDADNYHAQLAKHKATVEQYEKELLLAESIEEPELILEKKTSVGMILVWSIVSGICGAIGGAIIGGAGAMIGGILQLVRGLGAFFAAVKIGAIIGAVSGMTCCLASTIIGNIIVPKNNRKLTEEYEKEKRERDKAIASAKAKLAKAKRECNISFRKVDYYNKQIQCLRQNLASLYANRKKFYSVGVVPPDYRTMDCVYVLEQIFRNDLADTMREAVLLYEERVFRGEVIRGMQNVTSQLGDLSSLMSALRTDITLVGCDVAHMRDDMVHIYEQNRSFAADVARSNDRLYEETKLHRYAVEAIQQSNQKIVDYLEE